ncbi:hypothetical protein ABZV31_11910 [Streptomyces sp. NPDC005202]|uniref:hypothetical protein n=1 Tax=Streptomyces sp. NPDC005202 TaxID=3157021 RepID=UPI0033B096D7
MSTAPVALISTRGSHPSVPLTGAACVSRVYTDHGVFATGPAGVRVVETYGMETYGIALADLRQRLEVQLLG